MPAPAAAATILVDVRASVNLVALMTTWLSLTLLAPAGVALWYGESLAPFLVPLPIGVAVGLGVERLTRGGAGRSACARGSSSSRWRGSSRPGSARCRTSSRAATSTGRSTPTSRP